MKIAIMSDSHDCLENLERALKIIKSREPDQIIHAGDFCSPYTALSFSDLDIPFVGVFGNNDGDKLVIRDKFKNIGEIFDYSTVFEIVDGGKILITHYPDLVESLAKSGDYDFIIYGHTHKLDIRKEEKTMIINPGAISGHLTDRSTFIFLNTVDSTVEIVEV